MSFILDALRKSEHERQRGATPGFTHVPVASPPPALPRWAIVIIALLAVTVLVLAVAWWQSQRAPAPLAAVAPPAFVERALDVPPAPPPAAPVATAAAPQPELRRPSPPAPRPLAEATRGATAPSLAAAAEPAPQARAPARAAASEPTLPSAAALMAQGISLPVLRLELHVYAEQQADRFVFINGRKYAEGERLADGPELVGIEPQGVVLQYNGRRFLLLPE